MHALLLAFAVCMAPGDGGAGDVFAELSSPVQKVRDEAAARLRKSYKAPGKLRWDELLATIAEGDTKEAILARLPLKQSEAGIGTGQSHMESFRLDDRWVLRAWFHNAGDKFRSGEIVEQVRHVWVAPDAKFTGVWTTYFVNGQPSHVIEYKHGEYGGTFTSNYPSGAKNVVQHYDETGCNGEDTGYYEDGKVSYRAFYRAGKAVGTWRWFNQQGEVTNTREHGEE